jgi:lipopolysaccharide export system permease protein
MRILDRYLLREFLTPLATCVCAFSLLFVIFDLFERLGRFLNASAPALSVPVYYFHYLFAFNGNISMIVAILPISLLLAALYCASNLIRHNEFVAMMAGGVSFTRILAPFAGVGFACSLLALAAQEYQAPRSVRWMRQYERTVLKRDSTPPVIKDFLYLNAAERRLWHIPLFTPANTFSLGEVTVTQMRPDRTETVYFTGAAYWADGTWWLRNPRVEHKNPDGAILGDPETFAKRAIEMRDWRESQKDFAIEQEAQKDSRGLATPDMRAYLDNHPDFPKAKRATITTDYYARYASPFTCMIVALLGVPAGLKSGRSNVMARIILSLGFFFLFYFTLQVCLYLGYKQLLPPILAAWLPNLLFVAVGVRTIRSLQ